MAHVHNAARSCLSIQEQNKNPERLMEESLVLILNSVVVMSFTSVVVDRTSFRKTSEMARVKSFDF